MVAIKRLDKSSIDIRDRDILLELKSVRELSHENVNPFVGACVDAPNVCILMLYANKGSLQDVLQNDNMNLSWDFKISFATDIVKVSQNEFHKSYFYVFFIKFILEFLIYCEFWLIFQGMQYLHSSPIVFHGKLTSNNCLIDNRWTCKITDYGLRLFKATRNKLTEKYSGIFIYFSIMGRCITLLLTDQHVDIKTSIVA